MAMNKARLPKMYERWLVSMFRSWAELILDETNLSPAIVFSISRANRKRTTGANRIRRWYRRQSGPAYRCTKVDLEIDWCEGDVVALPLSDGEQFGVVVCQQALQLFLTSQWRQPK